MRRTSLVTDTQPCVWEYRAWDPVSHRTDVRRASMVLIDHAESNVQVTLASRFLV